METLKKKVILILESIKFSSFFLNEMTKAAEVKTLNISIAKHSKRSQQFNKTVWWTEAVYFDAKKKRNYEKALDIEIQPFVFSSFF